MARSGRAGGLLGFALFLWAPVSVGVPVVPIIEGSGLLDVHACAGQDIRKSWRTLCASAGSHCSGAEQRKQRR
jgi:hypothetical protein